MTIFSTNSNFHAYLTELILPVHLRDNGGQITQEILSGYHTPGISLAILPPTSTAEEYAKTDLLTSTFGIRDSNDSASAIDAETTFQAASISKPFTALAVLRLVAQGKLDLDTDIEEYLALDPARSVERDALHTSALTNPATAPRTHITLRLLLAHQSGLSTVWGLDGYYGQWATIPPTTDTINGVAPANNLPIRAFTLPGLGTSYSGGGTTVVQHILTLVTGKGFAELMQELVLEPLGMRGSTYVQPVGAGPGAEGRVNYAKAHHNAYTGLTGGTECLIYPEQAAAGLWTTPSDLLKGLRAVFDCLAGAEDGFLPPTLVAESFTELNGFGGFGIGWMSRTISTDAKAGKRRVILGHGGWSQGFQCGLVLAGDIPLVGQKPPVVDAAPPLGIAWMSNSDHGMQLGGRIVAALGWLVGTPMKLGSQATAPQRFFAVLSRTLEERAKVAAQIEGWRKWVGRWQTKTGGEGAARFEVEIGESADGLPTMRVSVLADSETPLTLLPAAFHHPEAIVWVVRDMDVVVAMKETKSEKGEVPVQSLEIWQNDTDYEAEKVDEDK
ncbi:beta-lactamase/transpeptidase-like protein [Mycena albidolilacea]|uniref:Beta-lactamase/transpeptidase-like protein n=1 Tax=Mycena albidolilacea TaxID=1033008 RepID=A0AAD7AAF9_9AGAR|nr:beta-lactamase/transpeptidase-like protein [Mycena albidolilacea]